MNNLDLYILHNVRAVLKSGRELRGVLDVTDSGFSVGNDNVNREDIEDVFCVGRISKYHSRMDFGTIDDENSDSASIYVSKDELVDIQRGDYFFDEFIITLQFHLEFGLFGPTSEHVLMAKDVSVISKEHYINKKTLSASNFFYILDGDYAIGKLIDECGDSIVVAEQNGEEKRLLKSEIKVITKSPNINDRIGITLDDSSYHLGFLTALTKQGDVVLMDTVSGKADKISLYDLKAIRFYGTVSDYLKIDNIFPFKDSYLVDNQHILPDIGTEVSYEVVVSSKKYYEVFAKNIVIEKDIEHEELFGIIAEASVQNGMLRGSITRTLVTVGHPGYTSIKFNLPVDFDYDDRFVYFVRYDLFAKIPNISYRKARKMKLVERIPKVIGNVYTVDGEKLVETVRDSSVPTDSNISSVVEQESRLTGTIVFYNTTTTFGRISVGDTKTYQFLGNFYKNDIRTRFKVGLKVSFIPGTVFSKVRGQLVDSANLIEITSVTEEETTFTGTLLSVSPSSGVGYIKCDDCEIGEVPFNANELEEGVILNDDEFVYTLTFSYSKASKSASSISILRATPKQKRTIRSVIDFSKYPFYKDETVLVIKKDGTKALGTFSSVSEFALTIRVNEDILQLASDDIESVWFAGVIDSFKTILNEGSINKQYAFSISSVISKSLSHHLRLSKNGCIGCFYSLTFEGDTAFIKSIQDLSFGSDLVDWTLGRINGPYKMGDYFTIDGEYRAYLLNIIDNSILAYFRNKDFISQQMFFKAISVRPFGGETDILRIATDIRSKYQIGKYKEQPKPSFQCGQKCYSAAGMEMEIEGIRDNDVVVLEMSFVGMNLSGVVDSVVYGNKAALPSSSSFEQKGALGYVDFQNKGGFVNWYGQKIHFGFSQSDIDFHKLDFANNCYVVSFNINKDNYGNNLATNVCLIKAISKASPAFISDLSNSLGYNSNNVEDDQIVTINDENAQDDEFFDFEFTSGELSKALVFARDNYDLSAVLPYIQKYNKNIYKFVIGDSEPDKSECVAFVTQIKKYRGSILNVVPSTLKKELLVLSARIINKYRMESKKVPSTKTWFSEENEKYFLYQFAREVAMGKMTYTSEMHYYAEAVMPNSKRDNKVNPMVNCIVQRYAKGTSAYETERSEELSKLLVNLPKNYAIEVLKIIEEGSKDDSLVSGIFNLIKNYYEFEEENNDFEDLLSNANDYFHSTVGQFGSRLLSPNKSIDNDYSDYYLTITGFIDNAGSIVFDNDLENLRKLQSILNDSVSSFQDEDVQRKIPQLQNISRRLINLNDDIEKHPSKIGFEIIRDFINHSVEQIDEYINEQYKSYAPVLEAKFHSISTEKNKIVIEVRNSGKLPAYNVKIESIVLNAESMNLGFEFVLNTNRTIDNQGKTLYAGQSVEMSVPMETSSNFNESNLYATLSLSCEKDIAFNHFSSESNKEIMAINKVDVVIQFKKDGITPLSINKYSPFADGSALNPDNPECVEMFYGRDQEIQECFEMITQKGKLTKGGMLAIWGQKRCGKTSVMNFLRKKIEDTIPGAIVLVINCQGQKAGSDYFKDLLRLINAEFRRYLRKNPELDAEMEEMDIAPLSKEDFREQSAESDFMIFLKDFVMEFGNEHPVVIMADEFTQAYIHMKSHSIGEDFLNRWRALITDCGCTCVMVGQDFMPKFFTDPEIISQNRGGAANGLGTCGKKPISYLRKPDAFKMIDNPMRFENGESRYSGDSGNAAKEKIYDLTGGSTYLLMKLCNAIADYMISHKETYVRDDIIEEVSTKYAFAMEVNPVSKVDFDSIYNELADDASDGADVEKNLDETWLLFKAIAMKEGKVRRICDPTDIEWSGNPVDKEKILKSLASRGVICDEKGDDISPTAVQTRKFKIRAGLFSNYLKERG